MREASLLVAGLLAALGAVGCRENEARRGDTAGWRADRGSGAPAPLAPPGGGGR